MQRVFVNIMTVSVGAATAVGMAVFATLPAPIPDAPPSAVTTAGEPVTVVDGDTVDIGGKRYRLQGYDTPEIYHAKCGRERDLGLLAAAKLIELMQAGPVEVIYGKGREKWGRGLARIKIDGRDVGDSLIAGGQARAYDGKSRRGGWCR